jgi:hypothetical protein
VLNGGGIGVGTIHVPIQLMMEAYTLEGMKGAIRPLLEQKGLSYYGILTNCRESGEYRKEVFLYAPHPERDGFAEFVQLLNSHEGFKLHDRQEFSDATGGAVVTWKVGNTKYSRKDFEKIITEFYK